MKQLIISIPYNNTAINVGDISNIKVNIKSSNKSRGISIRINQLKNCINLTYSSFISEKSAVKFLYSKYDWIYTKFANQIIKEKSNKDLNLSFKDGDTISFCGKLLKINHCNLYKNTFIQDNDIFVSGEIDFLQRRIKDFAKKELMKYIKNYILNHTYFNKFYTKIYIKDTVSRWGSCSSDCKLSFSFRLAFAPKFVIDYVIIHELCHLKEMNHSKQFWDLVYSFFSVSLTKKSIKWLNNNGFLLHKI